MGVLADRTYQTGEIPGVISINRKKCKGCDACKRRCPSGAITGMFGAAHTIDRYQCLNCGQCLIHCPFNAPYETSSAVDTVMDALDSGSRTVVGIIAPAVRVAVGEEFGLAPGHLATKSLYGAMMRAGFRILDNNYAADLTIMEEGTEFIHRVRGNLLGEAANHAGPLPQFTSCCPAWVRFVELYYPSLLPNLSTAKSPQQMAGALAKTYGAGKIWGIAPEEVFAVGIMPCTAKKVEASRPEFKSAWRYHHKSTSAGIDAFPPEKAYPDVDCVLTTRELAALLKKKGIDLAKAEAREGDSVLAEYSGAGTIFGNTGGVMEAALRTVHYVLAGEELEPIEFKTVRGLQGVKSASVDVRDKKYGKDIRVNVAVVHGLKDNIKPVLDDVLAGRSSYHFIEVMNCPGGCINGGGQPLQSGGSGWFGVLAPWFAWK